MMTRRLSVPVVFLAAAAVLSCSGKPGTKEARETDRDVREGDTVRVEILSIKGCQVTPPTIDLVKTTAEEMGISYHIAEIVVETPSQAAKHRFIGSPTVRVDGEDIDPAAGTQKHYGVT